jgi:hypothetical protein
MDRSPTMTESCGVFVHFRAPFFFVVDAIFKLKKIP